jgi:NAD(P)-dependent dehydrogenase (short-subunit alcohol dehydrogenase family)
MRVLLDDKNAVIYGDRGKVGGAVARAFAPEGARVFLIGRTLDRVRGDRAARTSKSGRDKKRRTYELEARIKRPLHRRYSHSIRVLWFGS